MRPRRSCPPPSGRTVASVNACCSRSLAALVVLALVTSSILPSHAAAAQAAPYCLSGQVPQFDGGFVTLSRLLRGAMGDPLDCEHLNPENGDTLQRTTTGLAYSRTSTRISSFTDGHRHWALTPDGLLYWEGGEIDPPPNATLIDITPDPRSDFLLGDVAYANLTDVAFLVSDEDIVQPLGSFTPAPGFTLALEPWIAFEVRGLDPARYVAFRSQQFPVEFIWTDGTGNLQRTVIRSNGWSLARASGLARGPDATVCRYARVEFRIVVGCPA